jgi:hypothetical protein
MPLNRRLRAGRTSICPACLPCDAAGSALLTLVERLVELTANIARASAVNSAPKA